MTAGKTTARRRPPASRLAQAPGRAQSAAADTTEMLVVGIGASAGGLAAFEAFFSGMPEKNAPGMAFVLVQHLAPDHKSILTELIRRYTTMAVLEVEDGMVVQPNSAYIIPPNRDMAFLNGALHLIEPSAPRGQRLPIDFFFRSLAQDRRDRAIGIVLSGTGSDGTQGARAIKGEGGMVMAQDPASTEYDGMPRSAVATGLVDFVLAPSDMPAQLMAYASHAFGARPLAGAARPLPVNSAAQKVFVLLRARTGHDFSQYKPSTIHRRIERRMAVQQVQTLDAYLQLLQRMPEELDALFRDLLIGVTSFFRDPDVFRAIEGEIIPRLLAPIQSGGTVRVWVPGCSTGEEAYSLAILLQEHADALRRGVRIQVFATDLDGQAVTTARAGLYPASIMADVAPERLTRYFTLEPGGHAYRIHKRIRDLLVFSEQDVNKDPPFSRLDLISCRNVLIYMGGELQRKLIPLFHYALNPGGFLVLGTSESVGDFVDLFGTVDRKLKIYVRKDGERGSARAGVGRFVSAPAAHVAGAPTPAPEPPRAGAKGRGRKTAGAGGLSLRELTEQAILQQVATAAALVDGQGDLRYLHGRAGQYLEPAPGEPGVSNVLKMAREGLRRDLVAALRAVKASGGKTLRYSGLRVRTNDGVRAVTVSIAPVTGGAAAASEAPLYLIVFEDAPWTSPDLADSAADLDPGRRASSPDADARVAALRQELKAKEEHLQAANEELETSNEELRSSNEEMQSVNEELQSTNEELETSKEELQSVNEELATVNAELQAKVADLSRANNDMNNLLAGTGIGTVFVDHQLRILRFTPAATEIINLIAGDVGRPVGHLVSNLVDYDRLQADAQAVLDTLVPREQDVQTRDGAWYTLRIRPYRTLENVIEGAVITFVDNTAAKRAQDALRTVESRLRQSHPAPHPDTPPAGSDEGLPGRDGDPP